MADFVETRLLNYLKIFILLTILSIEEICTCAISKITNKFCEAGILQLLPNPIFYKFSYDDHNLTI